MIPVCSFVLCELFEIIIKKSLCHHYPNYDLLDLDRLMIEKGSAS